MTNFNDWVISKISQYLSAKEGFTIQSEAQSPDTRSIEVKDTFGFRYRVTVEVLGRVYSHEQTDDADKYLNNHPRYK